MTALRRLALLVSALPLAAQTQPTAAPPPKAHIVVETVGPDGWRARLGPTNVGSMLASQPGRGYWQPLAGQLFGLWRQLSDDEDAFKVARDRLLGHDGTIRIAATFADGERPRSGAATFALVVDGDGHTDLQALAGDVQKLIERALPGDWTKAEGTRTPLQLRVDGGDAIAAPFVSGEHLVLVGGPMDDMPTALALADQLTARPASIQKPVPGSPALRVRFDVPGLVAAGTVGDEDTARMLRALGFGSLGEVGFDVAAAGPNLLLDASVAFTSDERGLFAGLLPATTGISPLLRLLPKGASIWTVGRLDCRALCVAALLAVDAGRRGNGAKDARAELKDDLGLDLLDDVLAHMTDEMLLVGSPFEDLDRPEETTWAVVFRLADDARFRKGIDQLLAKARPFLSLAETVDIGDVALHRYGNFAQYDLWEAAGNGIFVLAGGRDGEQRATDLLQAAAASHDTTAPKPGEFADLERYLPPGVSGVALGSLESFAGIPAEFWFDALREVLPIPRGGHRGDDDPEADQAKLLQLLREHNLTRIRTAGGYANRSYRWRLFW